MAARAMFEAGECFFRFRARRPDDGLAVPLQLQMLSAEHLPLGKCETLPNGNEVIFGIELDRIGRRVAYHFWRHVGLVVLGQHFARHEHAILAQHALRDDALALAEQVRQQAVVAHLHDVRLVGQRELDEAVSAAALHAALDHEATETKAPVLVDLAGGDVGGRGEERDAIGERHQHQGRGAAEQQQGHYQQDQALTLAQAHLLGSRDRTRGRVLRLAAGMLPGGPRTSGPHELAQMGKLRLALVRRPPALAEQAQQHDQGKAERRPDIGRVAAHRQKFAQRLPHLSDQLRPSEVATLAHQQPR
jgi:hypothetical protein